MPCVYVCRLTFITVKYFKTVFFPCIYTNEKYSQGYSRAFSRKMDNKLVVEYIQWFNSVENKFLLQSLSINIS